MLHTIKTKIDLQTVKNALDLHLKEYGFGVLGSYDFKKILENKNFPIEREITVYEICNPKVAQEALIEVPEVSSLLPCRLSIYEDGEDTVISTMSISVLLDCIDASPELSEHMHAVYNNLIRFMQSL